MKNFKLDPFEYRTIYGKDGEHHTPYQTLLAVGRLRLHIFHRGDADPDPHDHMWDFWTFPLTSYLEESWGNNWKKAGKVGLVKAFRLHRREAEYTHRLLGRARVVMAVEPEEKHAVFTHPDTKSAWANFDEEGVWVVSKRPAKVVTICWVGEKRRDWGFWKLVDGHIVRKFVLWREYIFG